MRFIDEAVIKIAGGHGGPGSVSFRRETFEPRGGPDGGDGGAGGDVIFKATAQLNTLQTFRFKRNFLATPGNHGSGANKAGRDGEDVVIRVPVGTIVKDAQTGEQIIDFTEEDQEWIACKGGRGGKGNAHFVTSTFQAPKFAQPGEPGEEKELQLELKLLADVAIIGYPNAGKSTLISRISAARPKIADYPFTTLTPNLGVVQMPDYQTFVVADIPGLIDGAHRGMGLGHQFLKHIERTRVFIHLLDGTHLLEAMTSPVGDTGWDRAKAQIVDRYQAIRRELGLFSEALLHKPEIVVFNKVDLVESDPAVVQNMARALRSEIAMARGDAPRAGEPFFVSAASGRGIEEFISAVFLTIQEIREREEKKGPFAPKVSKIKLPDDEGIRR